MAKKVEQGWIHDQKVVVHGWAGVVMRVLHKNHCLVADTQLYERLCPYVGLLVEKQVFFLFYGGICVGGGHRIGWGLDAPAHPFATIL